MAVLRRAYVYVDEVYAGVLDETDDGYTFEYDPEYKGKAVSLTLPVSEQVCRSRNLFPFFDGLIPEGWLLDVVVNNWKIDRRDRFGILLVACHDCIGNVSVREERS